MPVPFSAKEAVAPEETTGAALPSLAPVMVKAMSADRDVRVPSVTLTEPKESVAVAPSARA